MLRRIVQLASAVEDPEIPAERPPAGASDPEIEGTEETDNTLGAAVVFNF